MILIVSYEYVLGCNIYPLTGSGEFALVIYVWYKIENLFREIHKGSLRANQTTSKFKFYVAPLTNKSLNKGES